jgi:hypothetical protein
MIVNKTSFKNFISGIFFTLLLFNNIIMQYIPIFGYLDELIAVWAIIFVLLSLLNKNLKTYQQNLLFLILCVIIIGIFGNLIFNYQPELIAIIKDIIAFIKLPIIAIAALSCNTEKVSCSSVASLSKFYLLVMSIFCVISQFVDLGMTWDLRNGIYSFKFLFVHPTYLVYSVVLMSAVIVANGLNKKSDYLYIFLSLFLLIMSMRDKGFAYAALLFILVCLLRKIPTIKIGYIIVAGVVAFLISYNKIQEYASWSWSPRFGLYSTAFQILGDCFPIGTGFGTFANSISGEYYAKTYYIYGLFDKEGINPKEYVDLGDAGLAYFAEFGILGTIICLIIFIKLFNIAKRKCQLDFWRLKAVYLLVGYLVIASIVENVFCNESGATSMIVLFIYIFGKKSVNDSKQIESTNKMKNGYTHIKSYEV